MPAHKFDTVTIDTPSGRICSAIYGDGKFSRTAFYCHGFPGSRIEGEYLHESASKHGITIIAPDRPGFGLSEFVLNRSIPDFAEVVSAIASHFGVKNFSVMAISGGTPYALACAALLPSMVQKTAVVSGVAPFMPPNSTSGMALLHRGLISLTRVMPDTAELVLRGLAPLLCSSKILNAIVFGPALSKADKELLGIRVVRRLLSRNLKESLRSGGRGPAHDLRLMTGDWGFDLSSIKAPVLFMHGTADKFVPPGMMTANARLITQATTVVRDGEGHLLGIKIADEIVTWLASDEGLK